MALLLVLFLTSFVPEPVNQRTGSLNWKSRASPSLSFPRLLSLAWPYLPRPLSTQPTASGGPTHASSSSRPTFHLKLGSSICSASQSSFLISVLPNRGAHLPPNLFFGDALARRPWKTNPQNTISCPVSVRI